MKKRIISAVLGCTMVMGILLAGCGNSENELTQDSSLESNVSESSSETPTSSETVVEDGIQHPITTEPITFTLLASNHDENAHVKGEDFWFFKWLEYRMAELGYNVTIDVSVSANLEEQMTLMLNGDNLPDIVWGYQLNQNDTMLYGATDGIIMDWTQYMDEYMPNVKALFEENPDAYFASTCSDGGVYGFPNIAERLSGTGYSNWANNASLYINQKWLDECGLEMPSTIEEFIDTLRTFKKDIKLESGEEVIPYVGNEKAMRLERFLWAGLGYYGDKGDRSGTQPMIKEGQVYLPVYTDDYDTYVEILNTLYSEGLMPEEYFTMDGTTVQGLYVSGVAGVFSDYVLSGDLANFEDFLCVAPIAIDNNEVAYSCTETYEINKVWSPADVENPEVLAIMLDQIYSLEGRLMHTYGPMQGEDPLNLVDGWYLDEDGKVTAESVQDGTYETLDYYQWCELHPSGSTIPLVGVNAYTRELAGYDKVIESPSYTDCITGQVYDTVANMIVTRDNPNGYGRLSSGDAWKDNFTLVRLPKLFIPEEVTLRLAELSSVIEDYAATQTAKFITGERPLSEIPDFKEELKGMGIEEYLEIYRENYASYIESTFGN